MTAPVFGVIGWKNSGKTTLMARLVAEFTERGRRSSDQLSSDVSKEQRTAVGSKNVEA